MEERWPLSKRQYLPPTFLCTNFKRTLTYSLYKRNLVSSQMPGRIVFKNYFVFEKYFMKEKSNVAWNFKIAQKLFLENTQMIPDGFIGKTLSGKFW